MIISFVNQKGGVGKTTVAINIASGFKRRNFSVVFVDADPQGSATKWHSIEDNNAFEILSHPQPVYKQYIEELSQNYDYVVIDAPPTIGGIAKSILSVANLSIIPLSPSSLDIWSCVGTLEMIEEARQGNPDLDLKLLINRKIPGTRVGREAREALSIFSKDILNSELCQRVAYVDAMTYGVSVMQYAPNSKAAHEIETLCDELTSKEAEVKSQTYEPYSYEETVSSYDGSRPL
jgi:chromosome partitioning protein